MEIIANNISTRRPEIKRLFQRVKDLGWSPECEATETLKDIARRCISAGAGVLEIDTQQHFDTPEAMSYAVTFIQEVIDKRLCLSTNNPEALEAGLVACKALPIVNYVTLEETRIADMLTISAKYKADVILLVSDPSGPSNLEEMLGRAGVLIGMANGMGIPNEHIIVDPGIYHITHGVGQQHLVDIIDFLKTVTETFTPPVRTTAWLGNASAGVPARLRTVIDTTLLTMLATAGLSSVFLDALKKENMRTVRVIRMLQNEAVYAEAEITLEPEKAGAVPTFRLVRK